MVKYVFYKCVFEAVLALSKGVSGALSYLQPTISIDMYLL
jgi:hypothetical protein